MIEGIYRANGDGVTCSVPGTECLDIDRIFEAKRIATAARNRSYGVGDCGRVDLGVMPCGESVDPPMMLVNADRKERLQTLLMLAGVGVVLALFATPWFLGVGDILHKFFGR